jgi:hypothetical protein
VNEATEAVPASDTSGSRDSARVEVLVDHRRRAKRQASVWSLVVVVPQVLVENPLVVMIWVPSDATTSSKARVNLLSRSRMRNRGMGLSCGRSIESSRARWTTHGQFGWSVTPASWTRRVPSSMKNKT